MFHSGAEGKWIHKDAKAMLERTKITLSLCFFMSVQPLGFSTESSDWRCHVAPEVSNGFVQ